MKRLPTKAARELARELAIEGWASGVTQKGHLRFTHDRFGCVIVPAGPGNGRGLANARAQIRRATRAGAVPA